MTLRNLLEIAITNPHTPSENIEEILEFSITYKNYLQLELEDLQLSEVPHE